VLISIFSISINTIGCQSNDATEQPDQKPDAPPPEEAPGDPSAVEDATPTAAPTSVDIRNPTALIFNRIIVKFADKSLDDDAAWIAAVEKQTGAKVESVQRGPIQTGVVVFVATTPPRGEEDQATLARSLADHAGFVYAEADRLRGPR